MAVLVLLLHWWATTFLIAASDPKLACNVRFDDSVPQTGTYLLDSCTTALYSAMRTISDGGKVHDISRDPTFAKCAVATEPFLPSAFDDDLGVCDRCPEACSLTLAFQALVIDFEDVPVCSQTLVLLVRAFILIENVDVHWLADVRIGLVDLVDATRRACAETRRKELASTSLPEPRGKSDWSIPALAPNNDVAILVAATPSMIGEYQPFINLWRCYAWRHGLSFILETDDTEVTLPHRRAANWMRWFAARRHLPFHQVLLVVDPDQFVVPECWNVSIPAILRAFSHPKSGGVGKVTRPLPDISMRDFGRPQTLNNGMVLIRNSRRGFGFLNQLLDKAAWMQTIEKDQGSFDETVLEILGMEAVARGREGYNSECAQWVFPNARGNHEVALYALCWWRASERLAGDFRSRHSEVIHFADPELADVNHVVGARGLDEAAILHHFAGRSKDWGAMLSNFGLSRRATADCAQVYVHVDYQATLHSCVPGSAAVVSCEPPMLVC